MPLLNLEQSQTAGHACRTGDGTVFPPTQTSRIVTPPPSEEHSKGGERVCECTGRTVSLVLRGGHLKQPLYLPLTIGWSSGRHYCRWSEPNK